MKLSAVALFAVLTLAGCSSSNSPAPNAEPAKAAAAELETARYAFQHMLNSARQWAIDAQPYRLESTALAEANGQGGKAAIWRASFGSASRSRMEAFSWSGTGPESKRGVDH